MFHLEVFQNPYVGTGSTRVDAVLTISAAIDAVESGGDAVEGILLDTSGSMEGVCIEHARNAARKAIQLLEPSAWFFVVAFSSQARCIVELRQASTANKATADRAIQQLEADGGTVFSAALRMAREQFAHRIGCRGHVLFLTDGKNNVEDVETLKQELEQCKDLFQADCRGVGTDWEPNQLRAIAEKLLGTAQIIPEASQMAADFREVIQRAQGKTVGNVRLRLAMPRSGRVKLLTLKQMTPTILNLTGRQNWPDAYTCDFVTGAWGKGDSHDFHAEFEVPVGAVGDEMLVCRPSVVFGPADAAVKGPPVIAHWTADSDERSAEINPQVAHYTSQVRLSADIREGLAARARGDIDAATELLSRAAKMAAATGNTQVTEKLREIVVQNDDGTLKLKTSVEKAKLMDLDLRSSITSRAPRSENAAAESGG